MIILFLENGHGELKASFKPPITVVLCRPLFSQVGQYPELSQLLHSMPGRRKPLEHPDGPSRWPPMLSDRTQRPGVVSVAPRTSMPKMLDGPGRRSLDLPWTADGVLLQTLNGCLWVCIMFGICYIYWLFLLLLLYYIIFILLLSSSLLYIYITYDD
jgi:hypothetical protein